MNIVITAYRSALAIQGPKKRVHETVLSTAEDIRDQVAAWSDHPTDDLGRLLYGLHYNGLSHLYELAPPEIRAHYDELARKLTPDVLRAAAFVLDNRKRSRTERIFRIIHSMAARCRAIIVANKE